LFIHGYQETSCIGGRNKEDKGGMTSPSLNACDFILTKFNAISQVAWINIAADEKH